VQIILIFFAESQCTNGGKKKQFLMMGRFLIDANKISGHNLFTNYSKENLLRMVTSTYFLTGIAHEKFLLLYYINSFRKIQN